jgi:hypothetical protein
LAGWACGAEKGFRRKCPQMPAKNVGDRLRAIDWRKLNFPDIRVFQRMGEGTS